MKTIVLTGGGRGLGLATAKKLAQAGHKVVLTVRSDAAGAAAVRACLELAPAAQVSHRTLDLASLASVRAFAKGLRDEGLVVDVLFNIAGIMQQSPERRVSADGFEETLAVNTLGPYLLTHELWPALMKAASPRVVNVSSRLHLPGSRGVPVHFDFDDPQQERDYHPERAYKNSKLALLWFTFELARRAAGQATVNAVCPGFVPTTAAQSVHGFMRFFLAHVLVHLPFATSVEAASDSLAFMAADPSLDAVTGRFYGEQQPIDASPDARDEAKAQRFWQLAAQWTQVDAAWPAGR